MTWLRKLAAFLAVLLTTSVPVLACLDRADLTTAEQECCKHMAEQCGMSGMPDSHSCCSPTMRSGDAPTLIRVSQEMPAPTGDSVMPVGPATVFTVESSHFIRQYSYESPPGSISILRV